MAWEAVGTWIIAAATWAAVIVTWRQAKRQLVLVKEQMLTDHNLKLEELKLARQQMHAEALSEARRPV